MLLLALRRGLLVARPECPHAAGEVTPGQQVVNAWGCGQWRSYAVVVNEDGTFYMCHETDELGAKIQPIERPRRAK